MTKKAAALLLAASLAVSVCATPVFATGIHGTEVSGNASKLNTSSETTVEYEVTEGYKWAIPAKIDFGEDAGPSSSRTVDAKLAKDGSGVHKEAATGVHGESGNVYVSDCKLKPGTKLTISISSTTTTMYDAEGFYVKTTNNAIVSNNTAKLYYAIYKGTVTDPASATTDKRDTSANNEILELNAGTDANSQNLTFILSTGAQGEIAGKYTGTVAFEAKVGNT